MDVFPDNKTTDYRVSLPQPVDLEGDWEVGLYSVSYPNTWYTLAENFDNHVYYIAADGYWWSAVVDYGYYNDINEMIKAINTALETEGSVGDNLVLSYNDKIGKVKVSIKNRHQFSVKGRMSRDLEEKR